MLAEHLNQAVLVLADLARLTWSKNAARQRAAWPMRDGVEEARRVEREPTLYNTRYSGTAVQKYTLRRSLANISQLERALGRSKIPDIVRGAGGAQNTNTKSWKPMGRQMFVPESF